MTINCLMSTHFKCDTPKYLLRSQNSLLVSQELSHFFFNSHVNPLSSSSSIIQPPLPQWSDQYFLSGQLFFCENSLTFFFLEELLRYLKFLKLYKHHIVIVIPNRNICMRLCDSQQYITRIITSIWLANSQIRSPSDISGGCKKLHCEISFFPLWLVSFHVQHLSPFY